MDDRCDPTHVQIGHESLHNRRSSKRLVGLSNPCKKSVTRVDGRLDGHQLLRLGLSEITSSMLSNEGRQQLPFTKNRLEQSLLYVFEWK